MSEITLQILTCQIADTARHIVAWFVSCKAPAEKQAIARYEGAVSADYSAAVCGTLVKTATSLHTASSFLLLVWLLLQVTAVEKSASGGISITYAPSTAGDGVPSTLVADALVLATGGFAANKDMLKVRKTYSNMQQ